MFDITTMIAMDIKVEKNCRVLALFISFPLYKDVNNGQLLKSKFYTAIYDVIYFLRRQILDINHYI